MALLLPVLMLILLGTLDVARVFVYYVRLTDAVNGGALYGANVPNDSDAIKCRTFLESGSISTDCSTFTAEGLGMPNVEFLVTVTCYTAIDSGAGDTIDCDDAVSGNAVEVVGTYPFHPITSEIIKFFPSSAPLKKTVRMTI